MDLFLQVGGKVEEAKGNVREHTTGLFSDKEKAKGKGEAASKFQFFLPQHQQRLVRCLCTAWPVNALFCLEYGNMSISRKAVSLIAWHAAEGQAEHDTAQAKGWVEGATDSLVGNVKNLAGKALGDKELEAKGYAQATGEETFARCLGTTSFWLICH